jgi:ribose transport system substrate-binding protein
MFTSPWRATSDYGWGYETVRLLLDKIVHDKSPETERIIAPLEPVTRENAEAFREKFRQWTGQ